MEKLQEGAKNLGIRLGEEELAQFQTYYEELVVWNQQMNLTTITAYEPAQINHFLDSLTVVLAYHPEGKIKALDVGTGAGLPGIPLKIAFPEMRLVLLEATGKKVLFLQHIIEKLGLKNVQVITGRAEEVAHQFKYRAEFDLVLSRAVAPLVTLVEYTLPFCRTDGFLVVHKKGEIQEEVETAKEAITILKARLQEVRPVLMPQFPDRRYLVVVKKLAPTPALYPRQSGLPVKKPLSYKF